MEHKEYKDFFVYDDLKVEGKTRISPSSFPSFYENPQLWFKRNILKENVFTGNTNTVAGTLLHARIGSLWSGIPFDADVEVDYLSTYKDNPEVDDWKVMDMVTNLWDIIPDHLVQMDKPTQIETSVSFNIPNTDYTLSGTFDYLRENDKTIGDIKTTSTTPKQIKVSHRIQIQIYELIRRMNRLEPMEYMEVLYLVKTKKPKIVTIREPIDDDSMEWIKNEIKLLIKRLDICNKDKDMIDIIFNPNPNSYLT